jgi:hypothetical protein
MARGKTGAADMSMREFDAWAELDDKLFDIGAAASPRLHFRRGHYRHYPNHKLWIRWCLVGNPDLGFIDADYRL